ncbi:hypothetical protein [Robiginitalea sp.]|uniref:hypothetical protein n=1 Tax=Robiginitalea sp. TaxID=1902411 RepID=UPI003C76150C
MLKSKFWQAFFALAPFVSLILIFVGYAVFLIAILTTIPQGGGKPDPVSVFGGVGVLVFTFSTIFLISMASLVYYIVHAAYNPNLRENNLLILWILLFIFTSGLGQFIYWIVEIVNKPKQSPAHPS